MRVALFLYGYRRQKSKLEIGKGVDGDGEKRTGFMRTTISFSYKAPPRTSKLVSKYEPPSNPVDHAMQKVGGKVHRLLWESVEYRQYHTITKSQSPILRYEISRNNVKLHCDEKMR